MIRRPLPTLGRIALVAALLGSMAGPATAAEPLPLDIGGDFTLVDQRGQTRENEDFGGRLMLVWFGYTECPHSCGMALNAMSGALDELGSQSAEIVPIFVTVDPEHDTPARMAAHLANFHPAFVGLTGDRRAVSEIQSRYRAYGRRIAESGKFERLFEHTTLLYLMGRDGEPLSLLPATLPPERIAAILQGYL